MKSNCSFSLIFLLFCLTVSAQRGSVQGVISSEGIPLEFVTVGITELGIGGTTDANGRFVIADIPFGTYLLTVSSVGYDGR